MPLLVVPLLSEDLGLLTLREWDALARCTRVVFEDPRHSLLERLREAGVEAAPCDDELDAQREGWALVANPSSPRVAELARAGATVTAGPAAPPDALTAAHGAGVVRIAAATFASLVAIMARLRSVDGCPWDREQTHESLGVHLLEEAHEVLELIDKGSVGEDLEDELGDLLLQVVFHAQLARDADRFDVSGVAEGIASKLLRRHPHVFGDAVVHGASEVVANWETIKAAERGRKGRFEGIPASLPALLAAALTQKRAASLGFSIDDDKALDEVAAALGRPVDEEALGRALFWLVAVAKSKGIDPEAALRKATSSFRSSL
jgi:MazG family protein